MFMRLLQTTSTPQTGKLTEYHLNVQVVTVDRYKFDSHSCDSYKNIPSPALHCALVLEHRTCRPLHVCVHVCASCDGHASVSLVRSLSYTPVHQYPVVISVVSEIKCECVYVYVQ
jgi:hypothetical protein